METENREFELIEYPIDINLIATLEKNCYNCQSIRANQGNCVKVAKLKSNGKLLKVTVPIDKREVCELWTKHL